MPHPPSVVSATNPSIPHSRSFFQARHLLPLAILLALWVGFVARGFWNPERDLAFRDTPLMCIPNLQFIGESITAGSIPFIHLRRGAGSPFLADPQTSSLYPPSWFFALLGRQIPLDDVVRLSQFAHLWWLGMGFTLLALGMGASRSAAFAVGATAAAAAPHIHALEWLQILSGMSWVPWILLTARSGSSRSWVGTVVLAFFTGHAYLWVSLPALIAASLLLAPRAERRRFLLATLLLPALTAPAWIGYLTLAGEIRPHGLLETTPTPITAFTPGYLGTFLFPKLFWNFQFGYPDGRVEAFKPWGFFGWSQLCYVGALPILLLVSTFVLRIESRAGSDSVVQSRFGTPLISDRWAGGFLILAGVTMAMGLPMLESIVPGIFRHMHHPASFIHLAVWGILLLFPLGWVFLERPTGSPEQASSRALWFHGAAMVAASLALYHQSMSETALDSAAHPLWNFAWRSGWHNWVIIIGQGLLLGLIIRQSWSGRTRTSRLLVCLAIAVQLADVQAYSQTKVPLTIQPNKHPFLLPHLPVEQRHPGNRLWMTPDLEHRMVNHADVAVTVEEFIAWFSVSGFPNQPAERGWYQFNDYNPPFQAPPLHAWHERMVNSRSVREMAWMISTSGIGWVFSTEAFPQIRDWKLVQETPVPGTTSVVRLWRTPESRSASVFRLSDIPGFDRGECPSHAASGPIATTWSGNLLEYDLSRTGLGSGTGLFIPVTPFSGWSAFRNGQPTEPLKRKGFGLVIPLEPDTRMVVCRYEQPLFRASLLAFLLGLIAWWRCLRPSAGRQHVP